MSNGARKERVYCQCGDSGHYADVEHVPHSVMVITVVNEVYGFRDLLRIVWDILRNRKVESEVVLSSFDTMMLHLFARASWEDNTASSGRPQRKMAKQKDSHSKGSDSKNL